MHRLFQFISRRILMQAFLVGCVACQSSASFAQELPGIDLARDWPWWRGPYRNGHAAASARPPVRFGDGEKVLWKTPVPGRGHSSPIVVGGRVYLATADEQKQIHTVLAFDLRSGRQEWRTDLSQGGFPENNHPKNTEASGTLACDGERLFATFFHHRRIELIALGLDGQTEWRKDIGPFNPRRYEYGYAPSPLLYDSAVIAVAEFDGGSWLAAFERTTGKELWRTPRPRSISFSSPVVARVQGQDQLLISGSRQIASYNPKNGQLLWSTAGCAAATCGTMVWNDSGLVFASGGYPESETLAIRADGSQQVLWKNNQKCYEQSMIEVDGYLYGFTDRGILYCWRAVDGQEMWRERLTGPVSASPVHAGGHLYWANEKGSFYVFRPNPDKFDLVAENSLGNDVFASPAVSGNRLLLRVAEKSPTSTQRQEYLVCVGHTSE